MRTRRWIAAVVVTTLTALATFAVAQPNKPKPAAPAAPAKPKPGAAKPDAGAAAGEENASSDGGGAPVEAPPASESSADGGRPSPLNPTAQEMPGTVGDAGAPVDYDRLLADIAALRARVAAVSDNLYQSRINVMLQTDGDHGKVTRLTVALDDGVVYTAPPTFAASDMTAVYDHAVAPGRHAVTVDVERKDDREESFRTSQRSRFMVDVPRDNKLTVEVKIIDDSSMGADFPGDKSGKYDLRFRVKATAKPVGK